MVKAILLRNRSTTATLSAGVSVANRWTAMSADSLAIGSEGVVSLQEGRRFVGAELKASYYAQAVANLKHAADGEKQAALFGGAA